MSIELCILASGSSGNASVLRTAQGCILIDAGIGPRMCAKRLAGTGVSLKDLRAVVLTHLDSDHYRPAWARTLGAMGVRLYAFMAYARNLNRNHPELSHLINPFDTGSFAPVDGVTFLPIALAHDRTGSHGFVVESDGGRIGFATDLGHVPRRLLEAFVDLDVLAIEANYDPAMQMASARPEFLKSRIMNGAGHLSNQQAYDCVQLIFGRHEARSMPLPSHIVLLHRSRECNCPNMLRAMFGQDARVASRLTLAHPFERTEWLSPRRRLPIPNEQLALVFS